MESFTGQAGRDAAYQELVERHRAEPHAHCYRILGSVQDAEDALQDALLRAWRGLAGFEGRSSLRSWVYKITTNAALDAAQRRSRRELPMAHGPAARPGEGPGTALLEPVWVEPYPDQALGVTSGCTFDARQRRWVASVFDVLTLDGDRIAGVTGFVTAELLSRWGSEDDRFVGAAAFPRFGLPGVLPD